MTSNCNNNNSSNNQISIAPYASYSWQGDVKSCPLTPTHHIFYRWPSGKRSTTKDHVLLWSVDVALLPWSKEWWSAHRLDRLRNDLYCVEWDVKLYYTIPYHTHRLDSAYHPHPSVACNRNDFCYYFRPLLNVLIGIVMPSLWMLIIRLRRKRSTFVSFQCWKQDQYFQTKTKTKTVAIYIYYGCIRTSIRIKLSK